VVRRCKNSQILVVEEYEIKADCICCGSRYLIDYYWYGNLGFLL
jgi:redox-regulated HSP33 family molecular chaperone